MLLIKLLLSPLMLLYRLVLWFRNKLYDWEIFGSTQFDIPVINVGNLSVGGSGKTPHIEYLCRILTKNQMNTAVLSRGYKRRTKGYLLVDPNEPAYLFGDESFQIARKFKHIAVGVCENRVLGVPNLLMDAPATNVILLDDAYQHRAITAGLNILLTPYHKPYYQDELLPFGTLREYAAGYVRANMILVTKCPANLNETTANEIAKKLNPLPNQSVYFSSLQYHQMRDVLTEDLITPKNETFIYCFAGIADTLPLEDYLKSNYKNYYLRKFSDHKNYDYALLEALVNDFKQIEASVKILLTTEKDAVKLRNSEFSHFFSNITLAYLPISVQILFDKEQHFENQILNYVNDSN